MQISDTLTHLQRWTVVSAIALILSTFRLWIPQDDFPQVPTFEVLCAAPDWIDWVCLVGLLLGLVILAIVSSGRLQQSGCILVLFSLFALINLDQHRFQPWAYQLGLFVLIWLTCDVRLQFALMRCLVVSIYFYSAIGKLDFEFLHSVGQQMLNALLELFGRKATELPDWIRLALVATFPLAELFIAVGLAWPKSRRGAGWMAIGLHTTLIVILGPLGLNHRLGVLLWNAQFSILAYLLFARNVKTVVKSNQEEQIVAPKKVRRSRPVLRWTAVAMVAVAMVMPLTERFGVWDHWPSWALYAPHSSRVHVEVAGTSIHRLPTELIALINLQNTETGDVPDWVFVPIDVWSLNALNTPIYPQARFQVGVAREIASRLSTESQVRVTLLESASRFTGFRERIVVEGGAELEKLGANYWLNTRPREHLNVVNPVLANESSAIDRNR